MRQAGISIPSGCQYCPEAGIWLEVRSRLYRIFWHHRRFLGLPDLSETFTLAMAGPNPKCAHLGRLIHLSQSLQSFTQKHDHKIQLGPVLASRTLRSGGDETTKENPERWWTIT